MVAEVQRVLAVVVEVVVGVEEEEEEEEGARMRWPNSSRMHLFDG